MKANLRTAVVRSLRRRIDSDEYRAIRQLWVAHSLAEDARDIPGLMATLTDDCVYTIGNNGVSWHGKAGATQVYSNCSPRFQIFILTCKILLSAHKVFSRRHM